jgi:hypothetical protein
MDLNIRQFAAMFFTRLLAQDQKHTFDFVPGFEKSDLK